MLELKTYTETELAESLNIKTNTLRRTYKDNLKEYVHSDRYKVSKGIFAYDIIDYKEEQSSEFIKLCEKISDCKVSFPRESTAEKILNVLLKRNCTILGYEDIGYEIPGTLERHTVGRYIGLFRKYKFLPPVLPKEKRVSFNTETAELYSKVLDPNKYTYYVVSIDDGFREEIDRNEYFEMIKFVNDKYSEYLTDFLLVLESDNFLKSEKLKAIEEYKKEANKIAYSDCRKLYGGTPKKSISKVPTKEAYEVFSSYFDLIEAANGCLIFLII
ncbi:hypothetical protein [Peribacillus muralis]|uniref:hypothetical protein n=1 Tax=Peribacillus muralis TaxID=264697 RepID=UPI000710F57E|nr:hypothetical protein [Peribacillus muralis]